MKALFLPIFLFATAVVSYAVDTNSKEYKSAVAAYKFWYPTVSMEGIMHGMRESGIKDNESALSAQSKSQMLAFTANQDTPYGAAVVDLSNGPFVVEMPAGPFMGLVDDHHQRWIADMGLPGPDGGKGGKYLIVPPNYSGQVPTGYNIGRSSTNKAFVVVRVIPAGGDQNAAQEKIKDIKIYPLAEASNPKPLVFINVNDKKSDVSSLKWEANIQFWEKLAKVINEEPTNPKFANEYAQLKSFGIEKGKPFNPNKQLKQLLETATRDGKKEMLEVAYNAKDRGDRMRWNDRRWEWLILTADSKWATDHDADPIARDRYFSQAIVMSPAMLKRDPTAGSLYWGAFVDAAGNKLDGGKTYKLTVPLPVPARLFWSVTLYDTDTRSLISNGTDRSSLRSLAELKDLKNEKSVDLFFGPRAPLGKENRWVKTTPGKSWFTYFRIYGPQKGAFDNSWKPGDFVEVKADTMAWVE